MHISFVHLSICQFISPMITKGKQLLGMAITWKPYKNNSLRVYCQDDSSEAHVCELYTLSYIRIYSPLVVLEDFSQCYSA